MTRTHSLTTLQAAFAVLLFAAVAFAFSSSAHAAYESHSMGETQDHRGGHTTNSRASSDAGGKKSGGDGGTHKRGESDAPGKGMSTEARLLMLKAKFAELDIKKNELIKKIDELRGGASSTKPHGNGTDMKKRFCDPAPGTNFGSSTNQIAHEIRQRLCDRWENGSSTPSTPKPRASSTPSVKVLSPNGGEAYKHRNGAMVIRWKNTTADKSVDIDLEKSGSTTISIAKDVKGDAVKQMKDKEGMGGGSSNGTLRCSTHGAKTWEKACGPVFSYRFKDVALGTGYKVVVTAKVGSTTYSDKSDATFSIVAAPKGAKENARMSSDETEDGDVLGATTSLEEEVTSSFNQLEDVLALMSLDLSTQ